MAISALRREAEAAVVGLLDQAVGEQGVEATGALDGVVPGRVQLGGGHRVVGCAEHIEQPAARHWSRKATAPVKGNTASWRPCDWKIGMRHCGMRGVQLSAAIKVPVARPASASLDPGRRRGKFMVGGLRWLGVGEQNTAPSH